VPEFATTLITGPDDLRKHFNGQDKMQVDFGHHDARPIIQADKPPKQAAVLIPFVETPDGIEIILTLRADHLKHHAGQISFPGGRVEPSDSCHANAALREAHEEIGLNPMQVEVIGEMSDYYTTSNYLITPVIGWVHPPVTLKPDPSEVAALVQVPLRQLFDSDRYEQHTWQHEGKVNFYYSTIYQGHRIWGATAAIILALYEQLADEFT